MKLVGEYWSAEAPYVLEDKIIDAVIRNEGEEIVIDYEDYGRKAQVELKSENGIHFRGQYKTNNKIIGNCEFELYKNNEGYFLSGAYNSSDEGCGNCWIRLKPQA